MLKRWIKVEVNWISAIFATLETTCKNEPRSTRTVFLYSRAKHYCGKIATKARIPKVERNNFSCGRDSINHDPLSLKILKWFKIIWTFSDCRTICRRVIRIKNTAVIAIDGNSSGLEYLCPFISSVRSYFCSSAVKKRHFSFLISDVYSQGSFQLLESANLDLPLR